MRVRWESAMRTMEVEGILGEKVVDLADNSSSEDTEKGHVSKDCAEEVECVNCGKGHLSARCAWLKWKRPTTNLVGFGGPGLCCFVAEHAKESSGAEEKGKAISIAKVQEVDFPVDEELPVMCLGRTYPWKWTWQAKEVSTRHFLVNFPSAARISEVAIYDWVTLRGAHLKINVKQWSNENLAAGKLGTVWVRAKRVPNTLKKYQGICEVGSTLGHVIEVDMDTFRKNVNIRILVGVADHKNIPAMAKLTTKKLMIYNIYFQVEQVVEEGWLGPEEEYIQDFDEMEDTLSQEMGDRGAKI
ncbi:hypothetical protein ACQ4PT_061758 [Festuca glaucescens]